MSLLPVIPSRPIALLAGIGFSLLLAGAGSLRAQSPDLLLEEALWQELTQADPEKAMELYRVVLKLENAPKQILATANLRLGLCLWWRGAADEARAHFSTVVKQFPLQTDAVRVARRYLGQPVLDNPAVFMPADVLVYVELVAPRENVRGLSALLEGTPFQNPVDTYVASLARSPPRGDASTPPATTTPPATRVPQQAAFFNEGFLREMELIEALAFAVPGGGNPEREFVAVLDPGESNILRGLVKLGLTISKAAPVSTTVDAAMFRLGPVDDRDSKEDPSPDADDQLHLAFARDCLLLGRPRQLVEAAVERGAGRQPSLAEVELFRQAQAGRSGGIFFAYLGRERVVSQLRQDVKPGQQAVFDACVEVLGVSRFDALGVTLARDAARDTLQLEIGARIDTRDFPLWEALAAPALRPELLRAVPTDALGYFATRLDNAPGRVSAAFRAAAPLLELIERHGEQEALELMSSLRSFLASPGATPFLEAIDGVVVGFSSAGEPTEPPPFFAVLQFVPRADSAQLLEGVVTALFQHFLRNLASREFKDVTVTEGGRSVVARVLEPLPGVFLYLRRLTDDLVFFTQNRQDLFQAEAALAAANLSPLPALTGGSGKLALVRPRRIVERLGSRLRADRGLRLLLGEIDRVVFLAREESDSVSWSIQVPEVTPATRAMLRQAAIELAPREDR